MLVRALHRKLERISQCNFKSTTVQLVFYKTITLWFPCLDGLIQTLGNVARVKKCVQNHSPSARVHALFLTLATFPRVWTRPSKLGNHKEIVLII